WQTEQKTTAQIAIVMLPSIGTEVPKNFAVKLFEKWGIGQADTDNGLLILTVMDQRRTEFEVGYGLEPILTDIVCHRIGTDEIVPHFKKGEFGQGMLAALERVRQFLEDPDAISEIYSSSVNHNNDSNKFSWLLIPLLLYLLVTAILSFWKYGIAYDIERSKDDYYDKYQRLKKQKAGCLVFLFPLPLWAFSRMLKGRLKKYRYAPRYSKKNGQQLFLKDEWAENEFLEQAEILEEKLNSLIYDVWVTDD
ncbi:MAG: TPM domain-containing protein, partial [Flavobacteriaceae bacterium]|nr:TPM domain-containing protein [Flavobacteriaceae bacterium]